MPTPDPSAAPPANGHPTSAASPVLPAADRVAASPAAASPAPAAKSKDKRYFWRAMRFVWPYRRTILTSVFCALFVGLAMSCSLATLTPIMRVLLNNQTIQQWADESVVERRLGVRVLEDAPEVQLVTVKPDGPAAAAGLRVGDRLLLPSAGGDSTVPASQNGQPPVRDAAGVLSTLARDGGATLPLTVERAGGTTPVSLALDPLPWHLGLLRRATQAVSPDPVWAIAQIFGLLAVVAVVGNTLKFFQEFLSDKVAVSAVNDLRRKLYDHILHVPMSHFGRHGTTDVTSRLVQDSSAVEAGFKTVLGQSIQQPIVAGMAFAIALYTSWKLTLVIILFAPIMAVVIQKFGKKMRRAARGAMQKNSSMLGQIGGTLTGIRVVKAAGAERWERRRYRTIMRGLITEQLRMSKLEAAGSPIMETITLLVVGIIVLIATYMVTKAHTLSVTEFFLTMACLGTIGDSMRRLNKVNGVLQRANAGAQRIFEVIAMPVERRRELAKGRWGDGARGLDGDATNDEVRRANDDALMTKDKGPAPKGRPVNLPPMAKEIRFEHVTFTYPGAPTPSLVDVSLTVPKGKCVAVVGRNGSGKTTLLALLPRFYDVDAGRVTIDGIDLRDVTLRSLRSQISLVTQDSVTFPGTIAENIAYGHPLARRLRRRPAAGDRPAMVGQPVDPDAPGVADLRRQIEAAAKRAFAHEFILEKPGGYDTMLDGLGGQLSGGQRQRLCIARAILRRAPILILDEATSQVDAESEHLIQQAIDGLLHEGHAAAAGGGPAEIPTIFVIAHRFSTITSADAIVVIDRGRVVGQGRHDELVRTCEVYQQLYERQLIAAPAA
jgi:subfamily B ATP-binding cassette protein MsbA